MIVEQRPEGSKLVLAQRPQDRGRVVPNDEMRANHRQLCEQGFVVVPGLLSSVQLAGLRSHCEAVIASGAGRDPRMPDEIISHAAIVGLGRAVTRHDKQFRVEQLKLIRHVDGDDARPWHRDSEPAELPAATRMRMDYPIAINALWAIDDHTIENGCTEFVPGSHLRDGEVLDGVARAPMAAGSCLVWISSHVYHRTGPHRACAPRRWGLRVAYGGIAAFEGGTRPGSFMFTPTEQT